MFFLKMDGKLFKHYKKYLKNDVSLKDTSFNTQKRIGVLNLIFIVGIFFPIFYSSFFYALNIGNLKLYLIELTLLLSSLCGLLFTKNNKKSVGEFIVLIIVPAQLAYFPLFIGDIGAEPFLYIFLVVGFYILDNRISLILTTIYIISLIIVSEYYISLNQYPEQYATMKNFFFYPNMLISTFLIALSTYQFKLDTIAFQKTIEIQSQELATKVDELKRRELMLTKLLSELNHRVKNNLQFISSLFTMQIYSSTSKETIQKIEAARNRIDTIALLYKQLYTGKEKPLTPNLKRYIDEIVKYAIEISKYKEFVDLDVHVEEIYINNDVASHIGLIINELLTNSLKYGFSEKSDTLKIVLKVKKENNSLNIFIQDSGPGFDNALKESFGMKLINTICSEYSGSLDILNNNGAQVNISLNIFS